MVPWPTKRVTALPPNAKLCEMQQTYPPKRRPLYRATAYLQDLKQLPLRILHHNTELGGRLEPIQHQNDAVVVQFGQDLNLLTKILELLFQRAQGQAGPSASTDVGSAGIGPIATPGDGGPLSRCKSGEGGLCKKRLGGPGLIFHIEIVSQQIVFFGGGGGKW